MFALSWLIIKGCKNCLKSLNFNVPEDEARRLEEVIEDIQMRADVASYNILLHPKYSKFVDAINGVASNVREIREKKNTKISRPLFERDNDPDEILPEELGLVEIKLDGSGESDSHREMVQSQRSEGDADSSSEVDFKKQRNISSQSDSDESD